MTPDDVKRIEAKIDRLLALMERMDQDYGFCRGHPFAHSWATANGSCSLCGRLLRPTSAFGG